MQKICVTYKLRQFFKWNAINISDLQITQKWRMWSSANIYSTVQAYSHLRGLPYNNIYLGSLQLIWDWFTKINQCNLPSTLGPTPHPSVQSHKWKPSMMKEQRPPSRCCAWPPWGSWPPCWWVACSWWSGPWCRAARCPACTGLSSK